MSQVILITSAHYQALNAYHFPPHKWPENPPFTADENHQLNLKNQTLSNLRPFISRIKQ